MTQREFAIQVVKTLQAAGHQALWAGGCVRDQILGRDPKDYDVATSAHPDVVRQLFGKKRTLPIGASFGVITVLSPKVTEVAPEDGDGSEASKIVQHVIEVATFRRDTGYSDGRRPDGVEFTDAREDAIRRDFTINGMFYDPIKEEVIDYVGGQEDLSAKKIRAIGNPHERIEEDKLRMLRGIRFTSTFEFELDSQTLDAIQKHASEIGLVSGERIGAEMRRMLVSPNRRSAVELLRFSGLLAEILDDGKSLFDGADWSAILARLDVLDSNEFVAAAAILLEAYIEVHGIAPVFDRWKLSNDERKSIEWICKNWIKLVDADQSPWSEIQPLLLKSDVASALQVAEAHQKSSAGQSDSRGIAFCRERLRWPREKLDPKPFLDGADLIMLGIERGPRFKEILDAVRRAQLDHKIETIEQAQKLALTY